MYRIKIRILTKAKQKTFWSRLDGLFSRRRLNSGHFLWDIFVAQLTNECLALVEFLVFVSPPPPPGSLSLSLSRSLARSLGPCRAILNAKTPASCATSIFRLTRRIRYSNHQSLDSESNVLIPTHTPPAYTPYLGPILPRSMTRGLGGGILDILPLINATWVVLSHHADGCL